MQRIRIKTLTPKEKRFIHNFIISKTGDDEVDEENWNMDCYMYGYYELVSRFQDYVKYIDKNGFIK